MVVTHSEVDDDTGEIIYHIVWGTYSTTSYADGDEEDLDDNELAAALLSSQNVRRLAMQTRSLPHSGIYGLRQRAATTQLLY